LESALPWWKRTTVYQIYPRSFADSNADGIGDLPGIIDRLDYLQWLGVETLWLSPFYASPQADFGYDISGHREVAPEYGTLADLRRLIDSVHARGMKIVLDVVLNHTSAEHPWFLESRRSRDDPHRSFYLWRKGRGPKGAAPPNNWRSMLGGSGWHYDATTDEWYWATFLPFQPDLNWRNPEVKEAMLEVVRHWLREGADGLRLDLFNALYKDAAFADNPRSLRPFPSESNPDGFFQRALHTQNHPDTIAFAHELRAVVDEFRDPVRFVVGEVFGETALLRRYCGSVGQGLHLVFLFKALRARFSAKGFRALTAELEAAFPDPLYPTYVFGNHDRPRAMLRLRDDPARARLLAAFQLTVRGVPFIYYGEELGLPHPPAVGIVQAKDPIAKIYVAVPRIFHQTLRKLGILLNRDEARSPMPWAEGAHAGFSAAHAERSWLPMHPSAKHINVETQQDDPSSVLSTYRRLLALRRRSRALSGGRLELVALPGAREHIFAYRRFDGDESVLVVLNFSSRSQTVDLRAYVGAALHSSLHDEVLMVAEVHTLRPWEAILLFEERR
jgi:alpha-glucosidase